MKCVLLAADLGSRSTMVRRSLPKLLPKSMLLLRSCWVKTSTLFDRRAHPKKRAGGGPGRQRVHRSPAFAVKAAGHSTRWFATHI